MATYFRDSLLGMAHEFKAGLEFSDKESIVPIGLRPELRGHAATSPTRSSTWAKAWSSRPRTGSRFVFGRETRDVGLAKQTSAFLQDTLSKGRFTLQLGLRYDHQAPSTGAYALET